MASLTSGGDASAEAADVAQSQQLEPPSKRQKMSSAQQPSLSKTIEQRIMERIKMSDPITNIGTTDGNHTISDSREAEVGILHFVNASNPGFSGVLKMRYTDFLVNEVGLDGAVVHLTNDKALAFAPRSPKVPQIEAPKFAPKATNDAAATESEGKPASIHAEAIVTSPAAEPPAEGIRKTEQAPASKESEPNDPLPSAQIQESSNDSALSSAAKAQIDVAQSLDATAKPTEDTDTPENRKLLNGYFGPDLTDEIFKLYESVLLKPGAKSASFGKLFSEPVTDRPLRGRIHGDVRSIFKSRLETEVVEESKIMITAARPAVNNKNGKPRNPNPRAQDRPDQTKGKIAWDELGGQFLHFTLYKENKDTMEVLSFLCRQLKIKPRDFAFAGTKDRRAATVQRVSVYRQKAKALAWLNPTLLNARLGNFKHEKNRLELGELKGNQFTITLRDCHFPCEAGLNEASRLALADRLIRDATQQLRLSGFINYFGLQRFGTFGIGTDEVGKKILQGDFEGAVSAILSYTNEALSGGSALGQDTPLSEKINRDDIDRAHAIHSFKAGKTKDALDRLPRKFTGETSIIRALSGSKSKDYISAILQIPRNLRTMYVHAYQSRVWNVVASERWNRYGRKVITGDLILIDTSTTIASSNREEVDENGELVVHPAADDAAVSHDDLYERARSLTSEEAESGMYTIHDIVLPTPGFDVEYPLNDIGDFYKEFMGSEAGGALDPADMRRKQKDFSLSGSYRKLIATVEKDVTYEVKGYEKETEQLVETDLEKLDKSKPKPAGIHNALNSRQTQGMGRYQPSRPDYPRSRGTGAARAEETKNLQERYLGTAAHNAWLDAPAMLAAQDKERFAAIEKEKLTAKPIDPNDIMQPMIQDTFIETSAANDGERTGKVTTITHDAEGRKAAGENTAQKADVEMGGIDATGNTQVETQTSNVNMVADSPPLEQQVEKTPDIAKPQPAKIAVILKFTLGVSQYATMALRELMKSGGVKTYKPDYSGAR